MIPTKYQPIPTEIPTPVYNSNIMTQSYFCVNKNSHFRSKKTRTRTSDESTNMSSFNDSGGEDGGDICNIFDFDEDDH
jgi:hypothetical protein